MKRKEYVRHEEADILKIYVLPLFDFLDYNFYLLQALLIIDTGHLGDAILILKT